MEHIRLSPPVVDQVDESFAQKVDGIAEAFEREYTDLAAADKMSGRVVLRLPRKLHLLASRRAERDAVSLNTWLVAAVARELGRDQEAYAGQDTPIVPVS